MKLEKKNLRFISLLSGALLAGIFISLNVARAVNNNSTDSQSLSSNAKSQIELAGLNSNALLAFGASNNKNQVNFNEQKCGEGKCGTGKDADATKDKSAKSKCGEGKCGDGKAMNDSTKSTKTSETKCGDGK